jgi:hypothetical protein
MCTSKANLFKPIFDLQTKARMKALGASYWSSASKKRARILSGDKDVFDLATSRLQAGRGSPTFRSNLLAGSSSRKLSANVASSVTSNSSTATDDAPKPEQVDAKSLDSWIEAESQKEPVVLAYLAAFSQYYVAEQRLKEQSQKTPAAPGQDQLLLDLRYSAAVSIKSETRACCMQITHFFALLTVLLVTRTTVRT